MDKIMLNIAGVGTGDASAMETAIQNYNAALGQAIGFAMSQGRSIIQITTWDTVVPVEFDPATSRFTEYGFSKNSQLILSAQEGDYDENGAPTFQQDYIVGLPE